MEGRRRIRKSFTQITGIEERVMKGEENELMFGLSKEILEILTKQNNFVQNCKSGEEKECVVFLSESLMKLCIVKDVEKTILTTEITTIEDNCYINPSNSTDHTHKTFCLKIGTAQKTLLLTTTNRSLRDTFLNGLTILSKLGKEFMGSMVLKKYCDCIIQHQNNEESLSALRKSCKGITRRQEVFKENHQEMENQIIAGMLNLLITQIEIDLKFEECNHTEQSFKRALIEYRSLSKTQESLQEDLRQKEDQAFSLHNSIQGVKDKIRLFHRNLGLNALGVATPKLWTRILLYLTCKDIWVLMGVSSKVRIQTCNSLNNKSLWRVMCLGKLKPRKGFYRIFLMNFYKSRIRGNGFEVNSTVLEEIHNDVWQGLNEFQQETEEVLVKLCMFNPSLEYCQGMHFVSNFLFNVFRTAEEVLKAMDWLCRPPFYLSELWKNDFSRLRLGIYQLGFLMRVRLPLLYKHLKKLEIELDSIVSRWFLTAFTHLYFQFDVDLEQVLEIWDFFLVHGWPALISACLSCFYINEAAVLDLDYEGTLLTLSTKMSYNDIYKIIPRFEIDHKVLEDLDSSYASFN